MAQSKTPLPPTLTNTPTLAPTLTATKFFTPTPSPTPDIPVELGTKAPEILPVISPENISRLVPIAKYGEGSILDISPSNDGSEFTVLYTTGFAIYDAETLEKRSDISIAFPRDENRAPGFPRDEDNTPVLSSYGKYVAYYFQDNVRVIDTKEQVVIFDHQLEDNSMYIRLEFSPNAKSIRVAYSYQGYTNTLLSIPSGDILSQIKMTDATYSPDGSVLAIGHRNSYGLLLLDSSTGEEIGRLNAPLNLHDIVYSPDGKYIAASYKYDTWVWDTTDVTKLYKLSGKGVQNLVFSRNSKFLITRSFSPTAVRVWRMSDGEWLTTLSDTYIFKISPDGKKLFDINKRQLIDLETQKIIFKIEGINYKIDELFFTNDSSKFFIERGSTDAKVYDTVNGLEISSFEGENNFIILEDINTIITRKDGKIIFRSLDNGEETLPSAEADFFDSTTVLQTQNKFIAWWSGFGSVQLWNSQTGKLISTGLLSQQAFAKTFQIEKERLFDDWKFMSTGNLWNLDQDYERLINNTTLNGDLKYWYNNNKLDFYSKNEYGGFNYKDENYLVYSVSAIQFPSNNSLVFSPDGNYFSAVSSTNNIDIWNVVNGEKLTSFFVDGSVSSIRFSPDSKLILAAFRNGNSSFSTLQVWDINSGENTKTLYFSEKENFTYSGIPICSPRPFEYSPDGNIFVMSDDNCKLQVLDPNNYWNVLFSLDVNTGNEGEIFFSPDGKIIITVFQGGEIKFWDANNGNLLYTLIDHDIPNAKEPSVKFKFSEDGKFVSTNNSEVITYWAVWP